MRLPHLGGDEHLVARHARGTQALAHLALVVVHLGGVDVAIAEPQRLLDNARAIAPAQVPGAEPDRRYLRAFGLDEGGHGQLVMPANAGIHVFNAAARIRTRMAGTIGEATPFFERLCPAMTA